MVITNTDVIKLEVVIIIMWLYYVASSVSRQGEPNPAPSCLLGTTRCVPQEKFPRKPYNKSFIDQACVVKMAGYWTKFFSCVFMDPLAWFFSTGVYRPLWEARWPHGWCARLWSKRPGYEHCLGTLCCVLRQDTLLSRCLSPPRFKWVPAKLMLGGNPAVN